MVVYPYNHRAKAGLWFTAATHHKSTVPYIISPEKDQIQNSKHSIHCVYQFHTL